MNYLYMFILPAYQTNSITIVHHCLSPCTTSSQPHLSLCTTSSQSRLPLCTTSSQPRLPLCTTSSQPRLALCTTSSRPRLALCTTSSQPNFNYLEFDQMCHKMYTMHAVSFLATAIYIVDPPIHCLDCVTKLFSTVQVKNCHGSSTLFHACTGYYRLACIHITIDN